MRLVLQYRGVRSNINVVVISDGKSPALEFLKELEKRNKKAHRTLVRRYENHANVGPSRNIQHSRMIKNHGNLYEFKTRSGERLLYSYHPNGSTILLNGFEKGDPAEQQFRRGARLRDQILRQEEDSGRA